jgi:hypothetical protein
MIHPIPGLPSQSLALTPEISSERRFAAAPGTSASKRSEPQASKISQMRYLAWQLYHIP